MKTFDFLLKNFKSLFGMMSLCLLIGVALLIFFLAHVYFIRSGQTTYEIFKRDRMSNKIKGVREEYLEKISKLDERAQRENWSAEQKEAKRQSYEEFVSICNEDLATVNNFRFKRSVYSVLFGPVEVFNRFGANRGIWESPNEINDSLPLNAAQIQIEATQQSL